MRFFTFLVVCVVYVLGINFINAAKDTNIALNKTASQLGEFWGPEKAVDGCILRDNPDADLCCSASNGGADGGSDNFWEVQLGREYNIGFFKVTGRSTQGAEQLAGFYVYGQTQSGKGTEDQLLYNNTNVPYEDGIFEVDVNPERTVSIIRIERPSQNTIITLCEVEVYEACDDGFYGTSCSSSCGNCMNNAACDKVTGNCPAGCQDGWMGAMCTERENIALNKPASQSSTDADWTANRSVDGCTNQTAVSECCSKTLVGPDNYLEISLGGVYTIGKFVMYGPEDEEELAGFKVYYGDFLKQLLFDGTKRPYGNGVFEFMPEPPLEFGTITVRRENSTVNTSLTVCELELYEACPDGFYGDVCNQACGHCLGGDICYGNTGKCPRGCAAGWHDATCDTACTNGTYGENCEETCGSCLDNADCDIVNGSCPAGCGPGHHGDRCDMECMNGTYGYGCNETCGYCVNETQCDVISGNCSSCAPGYEGDMCKTECVSPNFGPGCSHVCNCLNNATCDVINGVCPEGCAAGWEGQSCDSECRNFTYGKDCSQKCGNCLNDEACDVISGTCSLGCAPGWLNEPCDVSCAEGFYGVNCTATCGNCLNNETCHFETGQCLSGCAAGWQGNDCKTECSNGTFGENCIGQCYCADRDPCDKATGLCSLGCDIGISGEFCHIDLNRAINKTAWQSSTMFSSGVNLTADRAVDGNFEQSGETRTCSSTQHDMLASVQPWWYIDMESVSRIDYLTIYGKEENTIELERFLLYLSNSTNITDIEPIYDNTGVPYNDGIFNISLKESVLAQFVHITLDVGRTLSLCEVRVFGECPDGSFGSQCEGLCYCANNVPCDKTTGLCPEGGCQPGWTGNQCEQTCPRDTYGTNCEGTCGSCADNMTCDAVTGVCDMGCSDGWLGVMCNVSCVAGYYGAECNGTCGQCKNDAACDHVTGHCQDGCAAGYNGSLCLDGCINGTFGENCAGTCGNCVNDTICDDMTGTCDSGCIDGYVPPLCANVEAQTGGDSDDDTNVGAIVGGVIGGVAAVIIIGVVYKLCQRRGKLSGREKAMAYYPSMATSQSKSAAAATNQGFHSNEGSVSYYGFDSSTKL